MILRKPWRLVLLASTALTLAACGQETGEVAEPAGQPVGASPTAAPGVPQAELDARQSLSTIGVAARELQEARDLDSARSALGRLEAQVAQGGGRIPADFQARFDTAVGSAREAIAGGNLAGARTAGQTIIDTVLTSQRVQDPTLVDPAATGQ